MALTTQEKPIHVLADKISAEQSLPQSTMNLYFIAIESSGVLYKDIWKHSVVEKTWVILTSDHGEMFEARDQR